MDSLKVGTRKSRLAQIQTDQVIADLAEKFPEITFEKVLLETLGDQDKKTDLKILGGQGVFTKRLQQALLTGEIDLAVHSAKDLPSSEPEELTIAAFPKRSRVQDCLLTRTPITTLAALKRGALIGTSSTRRRFQMQTARPDVELISLRGNIETRIHKLINGEYDAIIMAEAALKRGALPLAELGVYPFLLPLPEFLPAVGQGALAVETRKNDAAEAIVQQIDHPQTHAEVAAERAYLAYFGLGCNVPLAAYAQSSQTGITLQAMLGEEATQRLLQTVVKGSSPEALGRQAAEQIERLRRQAGN